MAKKRKDNKNRVLKEGEYQRNNGTYEYKWRDKRGNRHSVYAKTLDELREKELDVLRDVLDGIRVDGKDITINAVFERWVQIKRGLKDNTFENYKYMYQQFVQSDFGESKIKDLKRTDVRAFYNYLYEERDLAVSTIDSIHTVLHQVLELAVEDDYIRYNPSDNALKELKRAHNIESEKPKALTRQQQELFEEFLIKEKVIWRSIFTVMLWTGLRVGEATGLQWDDIDFDNNVIDVNHTLVYYAERKDGKTNCHFEVHSTKTVNADRTIPMLPKVKEALLELRSFQTKRGIKCEVSVDGYSDFIFLNRFNHLYEQGTLNKAIKRITRDCNYAQIDKKKGEETVLLLPRFSNHSLRHTFTTRMCENQVSIKAIQDILGHADAQTTLQIYATATKELKEQAMIEFDEFYRKNQAVRRGA